MQMQDSDNKMVNPWLLHLHKLSLALKCPFCKELLYHPILLPCDHLFCNSCIKKVTKNGCICPACKTQYVDQETRPALYIENVIAVFKSLCMTSLADTYHPLASVVKDVARLSEQSPVSAITNHGIIEEPVETSAEENSIDRKSIRFLHRSKTNEQIGSRGDPCGREEDRSTQSQPPDQLRNGNLVDIAVKTINMNQMKWLSVGRTRSLREIYKDAKRRKISNLSEAYDDKCGFGHTFKENGQILHYANQELVPEDMASSKITKIHNVVTDWTSGVSYKDTKIKNLDIELARVAKQRCNGCGEKGAALSCYVNCEGFLEDLLRTLIPTQSDFWSTASHGAKTWVFCGSALSSKNLCYLIKFARHCGATVARFWRPDITHVITATDANGSCRRTMKVLMGILYGRWIISMDWIKSCAQSNKHMDEEPYEVTLDNHGARDGPKTGRHLASDNGSKLFGSLIFYFSGDFDSGLISDLKTLVLAAGGTLLVNKEHLVSQIRVAKKTSKTLIVYNADHIDHCTSGDEDSCVLEILESAEDLALRIGSRIIKHTWILESIAACKLQPLSCY